MSELWEISTDREASYHADREVMCAERTVSELGNAIFTIGKGHYDETWVTLVVSGDDTMPEAVENYYYACSSMEECMTAADAFIASL